MFGHRMQLPREVIVGQNVSKDIGLLCRQLGVHGTALIIAGDKTWNIAGVGVKKSLEAEGYTVEKCLVTAPSYTDVEKARKFALEQFCKELLPVIDNLERALEAAPAGEEAVRPIAEGVELTLKSFVDELM